MTTHFKFGKTLFFSLLAVFVIFFSGCPKQEIVDLPAAELDAIVAVIDVDATPSDGKVPVVMQFKSDGEYVQLDSNTTLTCNGVALTYSGLLGYVARVPLCSPGDIYRFAHIHQVTTYIDIVAPNRPVILSPAEGATVTRSNNLTITYVAGGTGNTIRGSASDGSKSLGGNSQADTGLYTGFDVSTLNAGPGSLRLTREYNGNLNGTGFRSVQTKYSSSSDINVTWQ